MDSRSETAVTENGKRYTDETRELAYELWAFVAGENCEEVAALLAREEYGAVVVPARTVRDWVTRFGWVERLATELDALAPAIRAKTARELVLGGLDAARVLRRATRDDVPPGAKPDKVAVTAAVALLDRAGFSPLGRTSAPEVRGPERGLALPDVAGMSLPELEALEQRHLDAIRRGNAERERTMRRSW
jgi:hypothetical protein